MRGKIRDKISKNPVNFRRRTKRATTNVQHRFVQLFYIFFFFSFVLIELKPFVLKGNVLGEKFWKSVKKVRKSAKNYETILPFMGWPRSTVEKGPQSNQSYERENPPNRTF